jgi:hypothetical protein
MTSPRHAGDPSRAHVPQPLPAAGWYPQGGGLRYWDGQAWTDHLAPPPPVYPHYPQQRWRAVGVSGGEQVGHLMLTMMTCGMWLPVWVIIVIVRGRRRYLPR